MHYQEQQLFAFFDAPASGKSPLHPVTRLAVIGGSASMLWAAIVFAVLH